MAADHTAALYRSRSAAQIVDAAIGLLRASTAETFTLAAAAGVACAAVTLLRMTFAPGDDAWPLAVAQAQLLHVLFGGVSGALVLMLTAAYRGAPMSAKAALRVVRTRLWALTWTSGLVAMLVFLGSLLLLVPAAVVAARYFAVVPAIVLEGRNGVDAMRRSRALVAGQLWKLSLSIGIVALLNVALLVSLEALFIGGGVSDLVSSVAVIALEAILLPLQAAVVVVAFVDVRTAREGQDIEQMLQLVDAEQPSHSPAG